MLAAFGKFYSPFSAMLNNTFFLVETFTILRIFWTFAKFYSSEIVPFMSLAEYC